MAPASVGAFSFSVVLLVSLNMRLDLFHRRSFWFLLGLGCRLLWAPAWAQIDLALYTDHLVNGFQDWSWATRNLTNTAPVHSGTQSIAVNATQYQAISLRHSDFSAVPYSNVVFWAHGGATGGQVLSVAAVVGGQSPAQLNLPPLTANTWHLFTVPLTSLKAATATNFEGIIIQLQHGSGVFFLDDISLSGAPLPSAIRLSVDAAHPLRGVERRWEGLNTAIWDGNLAKKMTQTLLQDLGTTVLRFPGGSVSDEYHWASNRSLTNTWQWNTSFHQFAPMAKVVGADVIVTVNYGTGTPAEAAAWVRDSNITNHYGFRYWEVGNENYGTWETDTNVQPHEPYTYATRAAAYFQQMKAADPTIRIGVPVVDGENSFDNGYTGHTVVNPRTGAKVNGWTPIMLARLKALGVVPDFLVYHSYPEYSGSESDPLLLQYATQWARAAADIRQQVKDYYGAGGDTIELLVTENNSNSGNQGKQSTSLVNGLYLADSLGQLSRTEFNSFVWWDLRNGADTTGSMDPTLYGWRKVGDLGIVDATTNTYPTYYAYKLMHQFFYQGVSVLPSTSDHWSVSSYAVRDTNGSVQLLVINKNPSATNHVTVSLGGFTPLTNAAVTQYGVLQDSAVRDHTGWIGLATNSVTGVGTNFTLAFPPYSLTLLTLYAPAPILTVTGLGSTTVPTLNLQLRGKPGAAVEVQNSTNLTHWKSILTNRLDVPDGFASENVLALPDGAYWRGVYRPDLN